MSKNPEEPISQIVSEQPGDGIRSLKTSSAFRVSNFELYVKPNVFIMAFGLTCFGAAIGYIAYMKSKYEAMGYYVTMDQEGQEHFEKKKSKWD
ncbi:hypothetical protein PYW07_010838 [Mythimna separata]|uniref:Small integral membrane protein 8 n=1 Tax=Mythimna separata TaxID=271217 RepID=A0AAD7Y841_MYTSE|nr:hypothetical protein PYW07_010838 [Mythimna separata]